MSSTIKLDVNYANALRASKPTVIQNTQVGKFGAQKIPVVIPPLNTNIQFSSALPQFKLPPKSMYKFSAPAMLPETWNWKDNIDNDSDEMKKKKKLITKPQNQAKCGSCWAIATAGVINDVFVCEKGYNPDISTTYSLACYPQGQCQGGFPPDLIKDISNNGVASNSCVDYSWCLTDDRCSGLGTAHFDTSGLNSLIPPCGCYSPPSHFLYYVKNQNVIYRDETPNVVDLVKSHIYNHGPVLGGYHVFDNFFSGDYSKSKGVYLEDVDYNGPAYFLGSGPNWKGSHAVAIIGWGVEKGIKIREGTQEKVADVPYWLVRNSWGPNWGNSGGYFKIAMYPFNKKAQFEKIVDVQTPGGLARTGGIITFVSGEVKPGNFKQIKYEKRLMEPSFYEKDSPIKDAKPEDNPIENEKDKDIISGASATPMGSGIKIFIIILTLLIIVALGVYFYLRRR